MFEHYTEAKQKPMPRWAMLTLVVALVLHLIGLGGFLVYGWWKIDKLDLPKEGVAIAVSAPPPAPPPAKKGSRNKKKNTKKVIKKRKPAELTQAVKLDKPLEEEPDDSDDEGWGDPNGVPGGDPNSTCIPGQMDCDANSLVPAAPPPPPPPPKKEEPKIVPQVALEQQRISGEKNITPDDGTKLAIKRDGKTRIVSTVKMCLSGGGKVNRVQMLKSSGYPSYDSKIKSTMRGWKYRPFKVNGKAVPVCTSVTFIYNQRN